MADGQAARPEGARNAGPSSAAERLMLQHGSSETPPTDVSAGPPHLSYAEREAAAAQAVQSQAPSSSVNGTRPGRPSEPDLGSESAFPSLGAPAVAPKQTAAWGSGPTVSARLAAAPPRKAPAAIRGQLARPAPAATGPTYTEPLALDAKNISIGPVPAQYRERGPRAAGEKREPDPQTLAEVIRVIQRRHPTVTVDSTTSREKVSLLFRTSLAPTRTHGGTRSPEERVALARNELIARVAKKVSLSIQVPGSVRPFIIGARGKTLKQIIDITGAEVHIPRREEGQDAIRSEAEQPPSPELHRDDADSAPIFITISGEEAAANAARDQILAIVDQRTSRTAERLTTIPPEHYRLVNGVNGSKMAALVNAVAGIADGDEPPDVSVYVPRYRSRASNRHVLLSPTADSNEDHVGATSATEARDDAIVVTGHRDLVGKVAEAIEAAYIDLKRGLRNFDIDVPKRQHRLVAQAADEIFEATGSIVLVPLPNEQKEKVTILGDQMANVQALQLVMDKANATAVDSLDIATVHRRAGGDPSAYARDVARYLVARGKLRIVQEAHPDVKIYIPRPVGPQEESQATEIEFVGKRQEQVAAARAAVLSSIKEVPPEVFAAVEIDCLAHSHLIGRKGARIRAFKDSRGVDVIFPPQGQARSDVLLIYSEQGHAPSEAKDALDAVTAELQKLAAEVANIKSTTLSIPAKLHGHILGPNGTTLNAVIGEAKAVHVSVGNGPKSAATTAANGDTADRVLIRGPAEEVARVASDIQRLADEAEQTDTLQSFVVDFEIDTQHVGHIVGKAGAGIQKLREELGVRVDFADAPVDPTGRKRKGKSVVTIKGRKENVHEARKRISNHAERLADETTLHVPIVQGIDRGSLMGKGGKYILRLQDVHSVFINVPRSGETEGAEEDVIVVRGPKKGCEAAKKELVEVMQYEREHNNSASIEVPTQAVPRILGKSGSSIEKIKEISGAQDIDVRRTGDASTITLRGSAKAIAAAQQAIREIVREAEDQRTVELHIPQTHHQALIGKGGTRIREILQRAGGDPDARTVRFPRQGDTGAARDTVVLQGPEKLVESVKEELEKAVADLQDRVCLGVHVPRAGHAVVIGRGAASIKELQKVHNVTIAVPGWREWASAGAPLNADDLAGIDDADVIKIIGSASACDAAAKDVLARKQKDQSARQSVAVPVRVHPLVIKSGLLQRLPRGVRVDHGDVKSTAVPSLPPKRDTAAPSARIDDHDVGASATVEWDVHDLAEADDGSTIQWNLTASNKDGDVDAAKALLDDACRAAAEARVLAYATIPRSSMARVVGKGGSGLNALKATGAFVEVMGRKDADTLSVIGQAGQLDQVRALIEERVR